MNSVRQTFDICNNYDDSKSYPCYIDGIFKELTPSQVRSYLEYNLTIEQRLNRIEQRLGITNINKDFYLRS